MQTSTRKAFTKPANTFLEVMPASEGSESLCKLQRCGKSTLEEQRQHGTVFGMCHEKGKMFFFRNSSAYLGAARRACATASAR